MLRKRWYTVMYVDGCDPGPHAGASWTGGYKHIQAHSVRRAAEMTEDETGAEVFAVFDGLIYPAWVPPGGEREGNE